MAQAMTSMTGLCGSVKLPNLKPRNRTSVNRRLEVRAQHGEDESMAQNGRRVALGLVAAGLVCGSFANAVLADVRPIKLGPPPPPSGGLRYENLGEELLKGKKNGKLPIYIPPKQTVEALLEAGHSLVKEHEFVVNSKLSKEYMKNLEDE